MRDFLIQKLGKEKGTEIADLTDQKFNKLLAEASPKSKQQMKIFKQMLLPRISLYKVLLENGFSKDDALKLMEEHMVICGAADLKKQYAAMDKLPIAFALFKFGFTHVVPSSDLWDADIESSKTDFSVTMKKCFWHDMYNEYGCPEVCQFACKCDDITYSDLKHIKYERTQTLGTGGTCCDFHFTKIK